MKAKTTALLLFMRGVNSQSLHARLMQERENPCRLYVAPSHLSSSAKTMFGLYAGVAFDENASIPDFALAIPVVDLLEGPHANGENADILRHLEGALWTADFAGARWEGNISSTLFVPGVGSLASYHSATHNVDWFQGAALMRQHSLFEEGKPHPARGAITPYENLTMRATRNIPAGMELFANFGDVWDESKVDIYEQTITRWDYGDADKVLDKVLDFFDRFDDKMSDALKEDVLDLVFERVVAVVAGKRAKAIQSLLPSSLRKLKKAKELGGTFNYRNRDMTKSKHWLKKNGVCVDSLRGGKSTIPEAGRGAFATRDFKEGDRITVSPMLFIATDDIMHMFEIVEKKSKDEEGKDVTDRVFNEANYMGFQLLLNYGFGHHESSMLLIPTAPGVNLINHKSEKPNAVIDWSNHDYVQTGDWLFSKTVAEIRAFESPPFVIEVKALRDIQAGEEVFIDYGDSFDAALEHYLDLVKESTKDGTWPLRAEDWREQYKTKPLPLLDIEGDLPPGVSTVCFIQTKEVADGTPRTTENFIELADWKGPTELVDFEGQQMLACDVIARYGSEADGYTYDVKTVLKGWPDPVIVRGVPHFAITFVDKPYTGDIHTVGAFRRWIEIPDERFPQMWRNLRE